MSSSSCLDMDPAFEPRPGRTTRCVSIIFLLATWVIRSSTEARVTKRYIITLLAWPIRWALLKAWEKEIRFKICLALKPHRFRSLYSNCPLGSTWQRKHQNKPSRVNVWELAWTVWNTPLFLYLPECHCEDSSQSQRWRLCPQWPSWFPDRPLV